MPNPSSAAVRPIPAARFRRPSVAGVAHLGAALGGAELAEEGCKLTVLTLRAAGTYQRLQSLPELPGQQGVSRFPLVCLREAGTQTPQLQLWVEMLAGWQLPHRPDRRRRWCRAAAGVWAAAAQRMITSRVQALAARPHRLTVSHQLILTLSNYSGRCHVAVTLRVYANGCGVGSAKIILVRDSIVAGQRQNSNEFEQLGRVVGGRSGGRMVTVCSHRLCPLPFALSRAVTTAAPAAMP